MAGSCIISDAKNHLGILHKLYLLHKRESQSMASIARSNNALQKERKGGTIRWGQFISFRLFFLSDK
jgi:hypothetical protein